MLYIFFVILLFFSFSSATNVKCKILTSLPFNDDTCILQLIQNNTIPSINLTQQNINAIGTERQRMYTSCLPLTNSNNFVLEAH